MRGITRGRSAGTALMHIAFAMALLACWTAEPAGAQERGIDWVNFIIGTDHNGDETSRGQPKYLAEIHLRIPLTEAQRNLADEYAADRKLTELKQLLIGALTGKANNAANIKLIEALEFRPEPMPPGVRMGIDWVNVGTGTDYSGTVAAPVSREPRFFADIHLLFPLAPPDMARVEAAARLRDIVKVRSLLKAALTGAAKNVVNERIIDALELRPPDFE